MKAKSIFMQKKVNNIGRAYRFKRFARQSYAVFNSMHKVVSIGMLMCSIPVV